MSPLATVPPSLADFARRLLLHEAGNGSTAGDFADALARICVALHGQLTPLISGPGFDALFKRAVALATRDFSFLAAIGPITTASCSLQGLREAVEGREPREGADGLVAILANFIWLLVIFLGENLGLRKVHEVWPDVPLEPRELDSPTKKAPSQKAQQ